MSLVRMLSLNFVLRAESGIECATQLACHYRVLQIQIGTKYTCDTGQTRNKLLAQWVHL